jgi:uncharacterized protein (TIGR02611 family)
MSTPGPEPLGGDVADPSTEPGTGPDDEDVPAGRGPLGLERRYRAFRRGMRTNPVLDLVWRITVLSVGVVVLAAGVAMLALPGPGWAAIFLGLLVLASEFAWARRSLDWARERARRAKEQALSPELRRRNQLIAMGVALVVLVAVLLYWQVWGFPGPVGQWLARYFGR